MRASLRFVVATLVFAALGAHLADAQNVPLNQGNVPNQNDRVCPGGTVGKWPVCIPLVKPVCPPGTIGKWPLCTKPPTKCPKGMKRVGNKCVTVDDFRCPKNTVRVGRRCVRMRRQQCPEGTVGKWPDCAEPRGQTRHQESQVCPDGTVGQWPHCSEVGTPCPEGHVRKNKVCVALPRAQQAGGTAAPPPAFKGQSGAAVPPDIAALTADRPHRPREILVLVATTNAEQIATRLARDYNVIASPGKSIGLLGHTVVRLQLADNRPLETVLAAIAADSDVELAQPNYLYEASRGKASAAAPVPQYAPQKLHLAEAHRLAQGTGVVVAIIDTAIETEHPELSGAIAGTFPSDGGARLDPDGHGTAIAGIVAARAFLTGAAPDAKLLSVPAFSGDGGAPAQSTSFVLLEGIDWAFEQGARVMNMSFTGPSDPLLERIIDAGADKGAIFVAAAGNGGPKAPPLYPAAYPQVIAVTATDERDALYADANRGDYIAVAAPGVDIIVPALGGAYDLVSGTSMAAAHVSGIIALMLERDRTLGWRKAEAKLSASARLPSPEATREEFGAGLVDAAKALNSH